MDAETKTMFNQVLQAICHTEERINQRLDAIEQRLDSVEQRLDSVEQRLGQHDLQFNALNQKIDNLQYTMNALIDDYAHTEEKFTNHFNTTDNRLERLERETIFC